MVDFLNSFNNSCSHRLFMFDRKINKIEAELRLLEFKLNSIPSLQDEPKPSPSFIKPDQTDSVSLEPTTVEEEQEEAVKEDVEEETPEIDPVVLQYAKMVRLGVLPEAVKLKMKLDGVDPNLLKL